MTDFPSSPAKTTVNNYDSDSRDGFDPWEFLRETQEEEQDRLEEELERIERQLDARETIREENVDELESKLAWYIDRLETLYNRPGTDDPTELKDRITALYEEIRRERRRAWTDKQELARERRELLGELATLHDDRILDLLE